jgi:RNA polymerase sigma factor (sigma-70 family)
VVEDVLVDVFREQRARLHGFLARAAPAAAEDLLQETFLRTWDSRGDLGGPEEAREAARRYLWRVARNLAIDEIRTRVRWGERVPLGGGAGAPSAGWRGEEGPSDPPSADPGPADTVELQDALRVLRETVDRLANRRARRCLQLWLEGLDLGAIAAEVSLGEGQVRGLIQRARSEVILRAASRFRTPPSAPEGKDAAER